jgi:hypothetical protein
MPAGSLVELAKATSLVLYQGVKASTTQILTVVLGFVVIC